MTALLILIVLVLIGILAPLYGADTRDGKDWQPYCLPAPKR